METNLISQIIDLTTQYVSIPFILSINLITYFSIKMGEVINKEKIFTSLEKQIITLIVSIISFILFFIFKISNLEVLTLSVLLSPITYKMVIKKILEYAEIGYKKEDTEIL
jgi:hypothetical protein